MRRPLASRACTLHEVQLTTSTPATHDSKTSATFLHESSVMWFTFCFTCEGMSGGARVGAACRVHLPRTRTRATASRRLIRGLAPG